ncbi:MAG: hypothetical protein ACKVE4_12090 [Dissulfuribacterales bacterium]
MIKPRPWIIWTFALFTVLYTLCRSELFSASLPAGPSTKQIVRTWNLPTEFVLALSGEFKGLTADLVILEAGAYIGKDDKRKDQDWEGITRLFRLAMALDPYFLHTCTLIQGFLPWEAGMVEDALDLLSISKASRLWDWRPAYFMGFDNYYFLGRNAEAGRLLLEAASIPEAPTFLALIGARLSYKGGQTQAAIALLKTMLAQQDETDPAYEDVRARLAALNGVRILEVAIGQFKKQFGRRPGQLTELVETGILGKLPENPYGLPYCLGKDGTVLFDSAE